MALITWTDKTDATVSGLPESQKVTALSMAEIKSVVNTNAGLVTTNTNDIFSLEQRAGTTPATFDYLSATTASDPGNGKFKLDHSVPSLATHIYISASEEFRDISSLFDLLTVDSLIYIQDRVSGSISGIFKFVSVINHITWYDITMTVEDVALAFSTSNFHSVSFLLKAATGAGTGTVTSVTAGDGMTQSGVSTVNPTLDVVGGTGITANADDIAIDYDGNDNFIEVATGLEGTDVDPADTFVYSDDSDKIVKRGLISDIKEQVISGTRLANASVTGTQALDWNAYKVFEFTLTGNTTITDSNLPTGTATKVIEMVVTGDFTFTFPAYYEALPSNDSYDGTKRNHIVITCIVGTAASEDVIYSLQNLTT